LRARAEHAWRQTQAGAVALVKRLQQIARLGRRQAEQLITAGRTAAGLAAENERDRLEALDALAHLDALRARLPLVYRRLFSFQPVGDPLLLEQRDTALEAVRTAYQRWTDGQLTSAILLTGPPGSGRTSVLMALRRTLFSDASPATLVLTRRIENEPELAALIAQALDLDPGPEPSLNRLEEILQAESERHRIGLIENLEHLLLRAPSGSDLYERMAVFLSRTDGVVFWVTTMVEPAWHFLLRTEPQIAALSQPIVLQALDRAGLEAAVMKRHMRSGLPLVFAEPTDLQPLTRRRLQRAETEDAQQTILREVFFDRLFRASGGHLQLAFLHWLRTIDFEAVTDRLTVNPLHALDFSFIERFDLVRSFTLKALLQHGSLTLPEHDRVLRTTREESFLVFEALANELLIEQIVKPSGDGAMSRDTVGAPIASITPTDRYRIRPLVVNPVTEALRAKNML
ncbi:MAG: AAA family ATPase, partial [Rhodothermaceae bacterium]|nr:AAA family ATPase [Rhodothermaceae bacterium]